MEDISVIQSLLRLLLSEEIANNFTVKSVKEFPEHIEIRLDELAELVPSSLFNSPSVVLDGFCNPKELQNFPMKGKAVYLKLYRRRWKVKGSTKHYSNTYDFNDEGVKATCMFSSFLKDTYRQTPSQYINYRNKLMR